MGILFGTSHDLYTYYTIWFVLLHREFADLALSGALYLPHTWVIVTPIFMWGWPAARILMLLLNVGAVIFIWRRLRALAGLKDLRGALLLTFFCSWLSTGLVVGLGNLVLVCVAAMIAAFPFASKTNGVFLALSAMKQTIVFPVYFRLLFQKPKMYLLPTLIFGVCGVAALVWARLTPLEAIKMARESVHSVSGWTQADHTCLRRLISPFIQSAGVLAAINWLGWFGLFGLTVKFIKEPLAQLAALMLLSLLPIYHNIYDMVVAAPALAVFLKRAPIGWSVIMTAVLAANPLPLLQRLLPAGFPQRFVGYFDFGYYPIAILCMLAGLFYLEVCQPVNSASPTELKPAT
jgi:hypothetical protein